MCVLPTPLGPSRIAFSRRSMYSPRARSSTSILLSARDGLEVEALELLDDREPGLPDAALDQAALAVDRLHLHQPGEELHMIQALGRALARQLLVFPQDGRQLELLQVVFEQDAGRFSHDRPLRRAGWHSRRLRVAATKGWGRCG